jgi:hypothetical protein
VLSWEGKGAYNIDSEVSVNSVRRHSLQLNSLPVSSYTPGTVREHVFSIYLSTETIDVAPPHDEESLYYQMKIARRSYP